MFTDESQVVENAMSSSEKSQVLSHHPCKKILFVTNTNEYGGAEKHLLELIRRLCGPEIQVSILCFELDLFSQRLAPDDVEIITCKKAPWFLSDWVRLFRAAHPDVVVLIYGWFWALPWSAFVGAWLAGIRRRFSIVHLVNPPLSLSPEVVGQSSGEDRSAAGYADCWGAKNRHGWWNCRFVA